MFIDIDNRLLPVLDKISFASRYEALCESYSNFDGRLKDYDKNSIKVFYESKGLEASYSKKENLFKVISQADKYKIQFNTIPGRGFLQFVLSVRLDEEIVKLGWGMWESITRELIGVESGKPIFTHLMNFTKYYYRH